MPEDWAPDPLATFARRLADTGAPPCADTVECPDIRELDNGDVAVIGRDLTPAYASRLPAGVGIAADERLVVIPGSLMRAVREHGR